MKAAPSDHVPELDALRWFAFLGVFMFHAMDGAFELVPVSQRAFVTSHGFRTLGGTGRFGVDLFFTLSAFLITSLLLKEQEARGAFSLARFYLRRMLRIWPLYFGVVFLGFGLGYLFQERELLEYFWPYVLMVPNWAWALWGVPALKVPALGGLIVFWSLGMEEQFYLFWPLAMKRLGRHQIARAGWVLLGISAVLRLVFWACQVPHPGIYAITFTHLDPIAAGVILAAQHRAGALPAQTLLRSRWALVGGIAGFFGAGVLSDFLSLKSFAFILVGYPLVALSGYLVLAHTLLNLEGRRTVLRRGLVYLGRISYGLYVFHAFALSLAPLALRALFGLRPGEGFSWSLILGSWSLALAGTLLIAALSFRYFESPFLALKARLSEFRLRTGLPEAALESDQ